MFKEIIATRNLTTAIAQQIVDMASSNDVNAFILCRNKRVNAKSILGVISLGLKAGETAFLEVTGEDAEIVIDKLLELL